MGANLVGGTGGGGLRTILHGGQHSRRVRARRARLPGRNGERVLASDAARGPPKPRVRAGGGSPWPRGVSRRAESAAADGGRRDAENARALGLPARSAGRPAIRRGSSRSHAGRGAAEAPRRSSAYAGGAGTDQAAARISKAIMAGMRDVG